MLKQWHHFIHSQDLGCDLLAFKGGPPEPSWNFWLEEVLRRGEGWAPPMGLLIYPCVCAAPQGCCSWGFGKLCAQCPTSPQPLCTAHVRHQESSLGVQFHGIQDRQSVLGRFQEMCSSPLKACMYNEDFVLILHMPMLQSQAETTIVKVPWWEEFKCLLVTGLNLIFHVLKWSSSCLETLGAQLRRQLCSAIRFIISNTVLFQTFLYKQGGTSWVSLLSPTVSRSSEQ